MPICFDDCSTTDQTAQSLRVSRLTLPLFETERSSRPSSMTAAVIQASMPLFDPDGDGDGADAPALALEVGQFVPPERAADQQPQDHIVAFALQGRTVGVVIPLLVKRFC
jgi:hypothetical protein